MGRSSLEPGRYVRLLLVGYFEGIDSERGIAWRATDSLAVRSFLRLAVDEAARSFDHFSDATQDSGIRTTLEVCPHFNIGVELVSRGHVDERLQELRRIREQLQPLHDFVRRRSEPF